MFQAGVYANVFDFRPIIFIWPSTSSTTRENEQNQSIRLRSDEDDRKGPTWNVDNSLFGQILKRCMNETLNHISHWCDMDILLSMPIFTLFKPNMVAAEPPSSIISDNWPLPQSPPSSTILHRAGIRVSVTTLFHLGFRRSAPQAGPPLRRKLNDLSQGEFVYQQDHLGLPKTPQWYYVGHLGEPWRRRDDGPAINCS